MYADEQHHGHRQYLRTGGTVTVLRRRVGPKYTLLSGSPGDRPGRATAARVVGTVRTKRIPVLDATARGTPAGSRRAARIPHGRRSCRCLHGPHPDIPGTGREAEGTAR